MEARISDKFLSETAELQKIEGSLNSLINQYQGNIRQKISPDADFNGADLQTIDTYIGKKRSAYFKEQIKSMMFFLISIFVLVIVASFLENGMKFFSHFLILFAIATYLGFTASSLDQYNGYAMLHRILHTDQKSASEKKEYDNFFSFLRGKDKYSFLNIYIAIGLTVPIAAAAYVWSIFIYILFIFYGWIIYPKFLIKK